MATGQITPSRLNPFALPTETNARFTLLIAAALSLVFLSSQVIVFAVGLAQATPETIVHVPNSADDNFLSEIGVLGATSSSFHFQRAVLPFVMSAIVLLAAYFRYRRHPERVCRQEKLEPLDSNKGRQLEQEVLKMAAIVGLDPAPDIVANPSIRSQEAQAFGLPKRYVIRLDGRWRLMLSKNPEIFRTALLHEMGHIVNGDVSRYYFTEALWHAAQYYALIPMTVVLSFLLLQAFGLRLLNMNSDWESLFTRNLPTYLAVVAQLGIVWLITKAIRASVLRVREYYADARADLWGAQQGLRMLLRPKDSISSLWKQIRGWWKLHPTPAERLATIDDPGQLFKFSLDLPFLVGFLMAIISFGAFSLSSDLAANQGFSLMTAVANMMEMAEARTSYLLLALAIGLLILSVILAATLLFLPVFAISYLMSHILGLQFIREGLYFQVMGKVRNGRSKQFSLSTLLWLAGLELGFLILPVNYGFSPFYSVHSTDIFLMLLWWICAGILIWLWLFFAYQVGTRWLAYHDGATLPRWRLRTVMTVISGALWLFLIPLAASRTLILFGSSSEEAPFLLVTALGLATGLFFCGLLWITTWIFTRRVRCVSCKRPLSYDKLNQTCTHCGVPSLSWLLLPQKSFSSDKNNGGVR